MCNKCQFFNFILFHINSHESKFKEMVREEFVKPKQDHRTMGYAKEPVPRPNEYLKAHEKEFKLPERMNFFILIALRIKHFFQIDSINL